MDNLKKWKADPSKGEVFTPIELVNLILDKIPSDVWTNPNSTFLDPCMGTGTFISEIVRRLVDIYGYSELDAKSRVYGYEIRIKYINKLKRRGYVNLQHKDFLSDEIEMKFDVVIGNPPYQKQVGPKNTEPIWDKFVEKSFDLCADKGYISLIHPSGWRVPNSRFKNVNKLLMSHDIHYLSMNDFNSGFSVFGVGTNYDWYVVKKDKGKIKTKIVDISGNEFESDIKELKIIPNGIFDLFSRLIPNGEYEKVNFVHSESIYAHRKKNMSKIIRTEFIYPCVYTITAKNGINFWYSNENKGHFNVPKLIWSNGLGTYTILDEEGSYGLMEYSYGITDTIENLKKIKKVMDSQSFIDLMKFVRFTNDKYQWKIISLFRKDFWKEFLDEDGNVREL